MVKVTVYVELQRFTEQGDAILQTKQFYALFASVMHDKRPGNSSWRQECNANFFMLLPHGKWFAGFVLKSSRKAKLSTQSRHNACRLAQSVRMVTGNTAFETTTMCALHYMHRASCHSLHNNQPTHEIQHIYNTY
jgi:hypothetical protein